MKEANDVTETVKQVAVLVTADSDAEHSSSSQSANIPNAEKLMLTPIIASCTFPYS